MSGRKANAELWEFRRYGRLGNVGGGGLRSSAFGLYGDGKTGLMAATNRTVGARMDSTLGVELAALAFGGKGSLGRSTSAEDRSANPGGRRNPESAPAYRGRNLPTRNPFGVRPFARQALKDSQFTKEVGQKEFF